MRRIALLAFGLLLLATPVVGASPAPVSADQKALDAMNAKLAPVNIALAAAMEDLGAGVSALRAATAMLDMREIPAIAKAIAEIYPAIEGYARDGIAILDGIDPAPCFADIWAVQRVAYLLYIDFAVGLQTAQIIGDYIGTAVYLQNGYGELVVGATEC